MIEKITHKSNLEVINVLRFPLVLLVVYIHTIPPPLFDIWTETNHISPYKLVTELLSHHIGRIAVPCFFLFSGFFFFFKVTELNSDLYNKQIKNRFRTIFLPYLLWNLLMLFVVVLKNLIFDYMGKPADELTLNRHSFSWYNIFWGLPINFPLWYLRDLICMSLLSPCFYFFFKYLKWPGLVLLIGFYLSTFELNIPGLSSTAFAFFGVGAFFGLSKYNIASIGLKNKRLKFAISFILLLICAHFATSSSYEFWIRIFIISGVISVFCLGHLIQQHEWLKKQCLNLAAYVFFIYAIHEIYIINWIKGAFYTYTSNANDAVKLLVYFAIPLICIPVCIGLYKLLEIISPRILMVLIGGRESNKSIKS